MAIYNHLPIWGQNLACYSEGLKIKSSRYGKTFWKKLHEYEGRTAWSYDSLCEYRDARIREMVEYCYSHVPYYRRIFAEGGINPSDIRCLDDLKKLPTLNKDIVNKNPSDFISDEYRRRRTIPAHTSGTTGAGFKFRTTQDAICEQWAVWWRYRRRLGINFDYLSGNFGTRFVVPATQNKPPFWRYNRPCNQVYFSAFHERPEFLDAYVSAIIVNGIEWLHGYPSLLSELANHIVAKEIDMGNRIRFVTIGAENLLEHQAAVMERAFGVHVYQHYGLSEGVANFSEAPDRRIVVDEDFAAVEFVEEDGVSRIIGTNLTNYAMPLIRWETKDTAEANMVTGIGRVVTSLDGRMEDYVTLPSGKRIGKLDHVFKDAVHLKEVKIIQNEDYSLDVLYVPRDAFYDEDLTQATELFIQTFGEPMEINYKEVQSIEKSRSGKLRFIVSNVKR